MEKKGFSLIELLVVISVIGLLATFSLVQISGSRENARLAKAKAGSAQMHRAIGDDAVLVWNFDECSGTVAYDRSEKTNHGTITNGTWSTDTPSGQGCSLSFNGTGYVDSTSVAPSISRRNFSASIWFKTIATGDQKFIYNGAPACYLQIMNGFMRNCLSNTVLGTKRIDDNKWHFAVIVADNTSVRIYLDGDTKPQITAPVANGTDANIFRIAGWPSGGWYNYHGLLDEPRVYNRALTAQETHRLYAEELKEHERVAKK